MLTRKRLLIILGVLVAVPVLVWLYRQIRIDTCLDRGGAWNHQIDECHGAPQHVLSGSAPAANSSHWTVDGLPAA